MRGLSRLTEDLGSKRDRGFEWDRLEVLKRKNFRGLDKFEMVAEENRR